MGAESTVRCLLEEAGVEIGGNNPWDVRVHNTSFYGTVLGRGSMGLGEAYMSRWWDCEDLPEFFNRILAADLPARVWRTPDMLALAIVSRIANLQSVSRAAMVAQRHYDLPDALFEAMLDQTRGYTCGIWDGETMDLREAQVAKYDRACRNVDLQPGDRFLDIGFGWAGLMAHAKSEYGALPTGISVSEGQTAWARERYRDMPMQFRIQDYRSIDGEFDKAASIEMVEAVGRKNLRAYFRSVRGALVPGGKFVCQAIVDQKQANAVADPWVNRYIFPNGELNTVPLLAEASMGYFNTLRVEMFGQHYERTLLAWNRRFQASRDALYRMLGDRFCRMWEYYLLSFAGAFRSGTISVGQFTYEAR